MPMEVVEAMAEAARSFVDLNDLYIKAGARLAATIGVEAAFISCGAASGLALCAAACMTGVDEQRILGLPTTSGTKNEFVISMLDPHTFEPEQRHHGDALAGAALTDHAKEFAPPESEADAVDGMRHAVHQGIEAVGGTLVKVGSHTAAQPADIIAALGPKTAAVVFFLGVQTREDLAEIILEARSSGIAVIVDAAAQLPPRSNLRSILDMGATGVVFSGGKAIRGPQTTGLVLGQADLVEAVRLNANPHTAVGRAMKVGKEEVMGLVTALDLFLAADEEEELARWQGWLEEIAERLNELDGVEAEVGSRGETAAPEPVARAYVTVDDSLNLPPEVIVAQLGRGTPAIDVRTDGQGIIIDPMGLMPGEAAIVSERMIEVIRQRPHTD